jgi:hypothetical protein
MINEGTLPPKYFRHWPLGLYKTPPTDPDRVSGSHAPSVKMYQVECKEGSMVSGFPTATFEGKAVLALTAHQWVWT